jgi:phospholipase C
MLTAGSFLPQGNLFPQGTAPTSAFGSSVALSADGNTCVVGAYGGGVDLARRRTAYVFVRALDAGGKAAWSLRASLTPSNGDDIGFGRSAAISWDGRTILIGAPNDNEKEGAIYVFSRSATVWVQVARLTGPVPKFGESVALSKDGDLLLVGASDVARSSAWVFTTVKGGGWQSTELRATGEGSERFGASVALSAKGDVALIGAPGVGNAVGAAWVFTADTTNGEAKYLWAWSQPGIKLPDRSNPGSSHGFGASVALSAAGDVALVGCDSSGTAGGAWVFNRVAGTWGPSNTKLTPTNLNDGSWFGRYVALSGDGATALVSDVGTAIVTAWYFARSAMDWHQQDKLTGSSAGANGYAGITGLAVSPDAQTALLGGWGWSPDPQGAWVFDKGTKPISHVFVLMLENRSFDNVLGAERWKGKDAVTKGDTLSEGLTGQESNTYNGTRYNVVIGGPDPIPLGQSNGVEFKNVFRQLTGQSADAWKTGNHVYPRQDASGFVQSFIEINGISADPAKAMLCYPKTQAPALNWLARTFAVCDHWYASVPGATAPNRFFAMAASSNGADQVGDGWQFFSNIGFFGFVFPAGNIFQHLTNNGRLWRIYKDKDNQFRAPSTNPSYDLGRATLATLLNGIHWWDVAPYKDFKTDLADDYPYTFTLIEPHYGDYVGRFRDGSSQHPYDGLRGGDELIRATYEAIRGSPLWESSVLIVTYDEHGGFYDHLPSQEPATPPADGGPAHLGDGNSSYGFKFDAFGGRVPAVVVSPRIVPNTIDHRSYDHTSILKTVEELCGLASLTDRDKHANSLLPLVQSEPTDYPRTVLDPPPPAQGPRDDPEPADADPDLGTAPLADNPDMMIAVYLAVKWSSETLGGNRAKRDALIVQAEGLQTIAEAQDFISGVINSLDTNTS